VYSISTVSSELLGRSGRLLRWARIAEVIGQNKAGIRC